MAERETSETWTCPSGHECVWLEWGWGPKQLGAISFSLSPVPSLPPPSSRSCWGGRPEEREKHHFPLQTKQTHSGLKIQHKSVECRKDVWWESATAGLGWGTGDQAGFGTAPPLSSPPPTSRAQRERLNSSKCRDSPITSPQPPGHPNRQGLVEKSSSLALQRVWLAWPQTKCEV